MLGIVKNNPFRILGAYSDSGLRDVIANSGKIKAFSKVGRDVTFPIDNIVEFNEKPDRSESAVDSSLAIIQSDVDRPKYALFWFNSAGIDFGTSKLISGDIAGAAVQFLTTIETVDIRLIQEVIGDKSRLLCSLDFLRYYFETISEEKQYSLAISSAISITTNNEHKAFLSSLKQDNIIDDLKAISEEIDSLSLDSTDFAFSELEKNIDKTKSILATSSINSEILLAGTYDQICKSIRSKVIGISNRSFENIGKIEKNDFINIIKQCAAILKAVDLSSASEKTKMQYKEDIESMSNDINSVDDAYLIAIASNENICWYCGEKATHTETRTYEKKEEHSIGFNRKRVTTYTKSVKLHVCDECKKENESQGNWALYGAALMLIIECIISIIFSCNKSYYGFEWNWDWIWPVLIGNLFLWWITIYVGAGIGVGLRWLFNKATGRKSRHFIREESDHPLVKKIKKQGYS